MSLINKDYLPIKYLYGIYTTHKDYPSALDVFYELLVHLEKTNNIEFTNTEVRSAFSKLPEGHTRESVLERLVELDYLEQIDVKNGKLLKISYKLKNNPWGTPRLS